MSEWESRSLRPSRAGRADSNKWVEHTRSCSFIYLTCSFAPHCPLASVQVTLLPPPPHQHHYLHPLPPPPHTTTNTITKPSVAVVMVVLIAYRDRAIQETNTLAVCVCTGDWRKPVHLAVSKQIDGCLRDYRITIEFHND